MLAYSDSSAPSCRRVAPKPGHTRSLRGIYSYCGIYSFLFYLLTDLRGDSNTVRQIQKNKRSTEGLEVLALQTRRGGGGVHRRR